MPPPPGPPRLLLIAYGCSPFRGSEPGVGWQRALGAAAAYDTWVICEGRESRPDIERYLAEHGPIANLHVEFVSLTPWQHALTRVPGLYYLAYHLWHRRAFAVARRLHGERAFGLVHQVTLCGYREPGYGRRLGVPFVWGPVGGTQNYPWRLLGTAGLPGAARELARSVMNTLQRRLDVRVRRAVRTADVLLAANSTVARDLAPLRGCALPVVLETGVAPAVNGTARPRPHDPFRVFWCGELRAHKALPLLLRALATVPAGHRFELRVAGSGPERRRWERLTQRLGLAAQVTWLGQLTHADTLRQYRSADALVFTSLRDTSGNVVLEALAAGVPVIGFDHQGVHDMVTPACGITVPVTNTDGAVTGLRDALIALASDHERWRRLACGAVARAAYYAWPAQHERMRDEYRRLLDQPRVRDAALQESAMDLPGLRAVAKRAGGIVASWLHRALDGRAGDGAGVLLYHRVAPAVAHVPDPTDNVTPERFRAQVTTLLERGYTVVALADLIEARRQGRRLPPKSVVITFDDGHQSVYRHAWPLLQQLGLPATIFISTAYLGSPDPFPFDRWARRYRHLVPADAYRPLTEPQCHEMAASGLITFGAHGHLHDDFRGRRDEFQADLVTSLDQLSSRFGTHVRPLAYPFGRADDDMIRAARTSGVSCALTTRAERVALTDDPWTLGRFNVYQFDTGATLAAKLEGWYSWLPNLERRIVGGLAVTPETGRTAVQRETGVGG